MATVNFFIQKAKKADTASIWCRFRAGRDTDMKATTGLTVVPEHWNPKRQTVKNIAEATYKDDTNEKLGKLKNYILSEYARCEGNVQGKWLLNVLEEAETPGRKKNAPKTLYSFIEDFIRKAPQRKNPKTGNPVCYKMQREYQRTYDLIKEFANDRGHEVDFKDINEDFYIDFVEYLESRNLAKNTIGKKIQTLKIFLNSATYIGLNTYLYYKARGFVSMSEESDQVYLCEDELSLIEAADISPELQIMRDWFLIGCWTGLRYSDWHQVNTDNIKGDKLFAKQQKTGNKVIIPILPITRRILDKYENQLPKPPTNQHMNRSLKDIAAAAGIDEPIQTETTRGGKRITTSTPKYSLVRTHTARRSFATNMYKKGFPTIAIMAITGHKTESAFLKYIRVTPDENAERIIELWNRNEMKAVK